jgi:hypothetical protein
MSSPLGEASGNGDGSKKELNKVSLAPVRAATSAAFDSE